MDQCIYITLEKDELSVRRFKIYQEALYFSIGRKIYGFLF